MKESKKTDGMEEIQWIDISSNLISNPTKDSKQGDSEERITNKNEATDIFVEKLSDKITKDEIENNFFYDEDMDELSSSLAEQISETLLETAAVDDKDIKSQTDVKSGNNIEINEEKTKQKRHTKFIKLACIVLASVLFVGLFMIFTKPGQYIAFKIAASYMTDKMNYNDGSKDTLGEETDEVEEIAPEITQMQEEDIKLNANEGLLREEDFVTNILLLGEENIDSYGARGRTDLIMIATLNEKDKSIKLTSIMRDTFIQIPGYKDNKINSAYALGGIDLLYEAIELNFDIKVDGYMLVGFDDFERIIDLLGGIDITLTNTEANWLNNSNYVTELSNRNLVGGVNHMNGDQALGYCRIRQVGTGEKEYDDFGRTSRHRTMINAIFLKYKEKNLIDLMLIVNKLLPMVTTDITSDELTTYLQKAYNIGLTEIKSFRVPASGTYRSTYVREMSVLIPNLSDNVKLLHEFIFGINE